MKLKLALLFIASLAWAQDQPATSTLSSISEKVQREKGSDATIQETIKPVLSEAQLHRYWHAVAILTEAQTNMKSAQEEYAAALADVQKTCPLQMDPLTKDLKCVSPAPAAPTKPPSQ